MAWAVLIGDKGAVLNVQTVAQGRPSLDWEGDSSNTSYFVESVAIQDRSERRPRMPRL
jgi:hypothetical protein